MDVTNYVLDRIRLRLRDRAYHLLSGDGKLHHYPSEIRQLARTIQPQVVTNDGWFAELPVTGWSPENGPALESWLLPLATYSLNAQDLNWDKNDDDVEDLFALHRFTWLLRWLALRPGKENLKTADELILDWIDRVGSRKQPPIWETYSASERVVNWLLYFCATKETRSLDANTAEIIFRALHEHLLHISQYLEYYGEAFNNHILNNARALYIGGRFLGLPQFAELGRTLFQRHAPELIDKQGVLLEDSTHYQLLLTRAFAEVLWVARTTADDTFIRFLEPVARSMMGCCLFIGDHVRGTLDESFPRVGDMSPDFPLAWFCPNRHKEDHLGSWWALWDPAKLSSMVNEADSFVKQSSAEWRWVSDPSDTYRIMVHTPRDAQTYPRGHGHLDFGSFLLYDADEPLLVDRGRCSYRSDEIGAYGFSAQAHNTTLINGQPLLPNSIGLSRGYRAFLNNCMSVEIGTGDHDSKLSWQTGAINRLGPSLAWGRTLVLTPQGIDISERISNSKGIEITVESYLHWAPGWTISPDSSKAGSHYRSVVKKGEKGFYLDIHHTGDDFCVDWFAADDASPQGWHFPDYGRKIPALTLRLCFRTSQDSVFQFLIRPL